VQALPEDGRGKLAILDADGTLYRDDVADDFCSWMIAEGHVKTGDNWDEYLRIYREDHARGCRFMLSFYEGLPLAEFHRLIRHWWASVERTWIVEVLESVYLLSERGYEVWIVTGSPTDTMLPLKEFLPIDETVGMDFEVDDQGIITGKLSGISCADEGKAEKIRSLWDGPILFAAGNGRLDAAMMELSEQVIWSVYPNAEFLAFSEAKPGWHITPRPADFVEEAKLA